MLLKNLSFEENIGKPNSWRIDGLTFGQINLIVGKNSSGKSRTTNVINVLARLVSGKLIPQFPSGKWTAEFERAKGQAKEVQKYELTVENSTVVSESFHIGKLSIMQRDRSGAGFVVRRANNEKIRYKVPPNQLMAVVRRDEIQHPQFESLYKWGQNLCLYRFGSDFGKGSADIITPTDPAAAEVFPFSEQTENTVHVFRRTMERFEKEYSKRLIDQMNKLGYACESIGLTHVNNVMFNGVPPIVIALKERDLAAYTGQAEMSQGMYRALAILIQVNANILWTQAMMVGRSPGQGEPPTVVIDDIGEGLDYERSRKLIDVLIGLSKESNFQLIMSSNDRFIMNDVPLEYWTVLHRSGSVVKPYNYENSKDIFDEFRYLGLNNFDFFSGEHFLHRQEV